nr:immunoglobulin heavy chain junction region [Macaca mulatta]
CARFGSEGGNDYYFDYW